MLGYVKIDKGELKVREYEVYCGYYCGICKSIGRRYGQLPRMALSYDAAFLAILLASIEDAPDAPLQEHCVVHPIKKKTMIYNRAVDYAGDVMLLLAWYKLLDDAKDENRFYAKATMVLLRSIYRDLRKQYPDLCKGIEENLAKLTALEQAKCDSIDQAADAFSQIMKIIFQEGIRTLYEADVVTIEPEHPAKEHADPQSLIETAGQIGWHLGKWIYLIDAVDDIEKDIKSGSYNPLKAKFPDANSLSGVEFRKFAKERLDLTAGETANALGGLKFNRFGDIIENVVCDGMFASQTEVFRKKEGVKNEKESVLGSRSTGHGE